MKEKLKAIGIAIIITSVFLGIGYFINHVFNHFLKEERPDELCKKMQEICDNQTLIGLSKEEVKEMLGKPKEEYNNESGDIYSYYAGGIDTGLFWNDKTIFLDYDYGCELSILFDKNYKVESTSIKMIP